MIRGDEFFFLFYKINLIWTYFFSSGIFKLSLYIVSLLSYKSIYNYIVFLLIIIEMSAKILYILQNNLFCFRINFNNGCVLINFYIRK